MKQQLLITLLHIFCVTTVSAAHSGWLLFGGVDAIGYNIAQLSFQQGKKISIIYDEQEQAVYDRYYKENPLVVPYDRSIPQPSAPEEVKYIYISVDNYPNISTQEYLARIDFVIKMAQAHNALIIMPLSVELFGNYGTITEKSAPLPTSEYGLHLLSCQKHLEMQAQEKNCRIRTLRHNKLFGPGSRSTLITFNIERLITNNPCSWISRSDIPQQLSFAPDVARFILEYIKYAPKMKMNTFNIGGIIYPSLKNFGKRIAEILGKKYQEILYTPTEFFFYHMFNDTLHTTIDTSYTHKQTIILNDEIRQTLFPLFSLTGMREAVEETVSWHLMQKG